MMKIFETRIGKAFTLLFLMALATFGLLWFFNHSAELSVGVFRSADTVEFDKGAMYMLGGGIGIICLLILSVPAVFFGKSPSKVIEERAIKGLIAGLVLTFTLPHLVHVSISTTLKNRDYVICQELTSRWLMHVTFVYASSPERCMEEMMYRR